RIVRPLASSPAQDSLFGLNGFTVSIAPGAYSVQLAIIMITGGLQFNRERNGLVRMRTTWLALMALALSLSCQRVPEGKETTKGVPIMSLNIESSAFKSGGTIPKKYTADGPDVSPPLSWSEPPAGTESLALICDDPDAPVGDWVHWVLWGLPAQTRELP